MGCLLSRSEASSPQKVERDLQPVGGVLPAMPQHSLRSTSSPAQAASAPLAFRSSVQSAIEFVESGNNGSSSSSSGGGSKAKLCCDKCDGTHATDACPHYKKKREDHPDGKSTPRTNLCICVLSLLISRLRALYTFNFAVTCDSSSTAWRHVGRKPKDMGCDGGNFVVASARVVRQPGDGSCLFHSLSYGLGDGTSASQVVLHCLCSLPPLPHDSLMQLRRELASFVLKHPDLEIADDPLKDWIAWDSEGGR
jgi:hypothetical protein